MNAFTKEAIKVFLEDQMQFFEEKMADTVHEAKEVLEEYMAMELNNIAEVKEFMKENGMDIAGMSDEEIMDQSEVFPLPSGRFLVIPG